MEEDGVASAARVSRVTSGLFGCGCQSPRFQQTVRVHFHMRLCSLLTTLCRYSQIDSSDEEAILTWDSVPSLTLAAIKYYDGIALLPA